MYRQIYLGYIIYIHLYYFGYFTEVRLQGIISERVDKQNKHHLRSEVCDIKQREACLNNISWMPFITAIILQGVCLHINKANSNDFTLLQDIWEERACALTTCLSSRDRTRHNDTGWWLTEHKEL